jgi:hypothetical protein
MAQSIFLARLAANDFDNAIKFANMITDDGIKEAQLRSLGTKLVKSGNADQALRLAENEASPLIKVYILLGVVDGILDGKQN